jgi:uncharacterized membrane protein
MQPASSSGIDKKTGSWLSYLLGWLTGIIMLFVGKNDPDVKFHAAQSTVFFGSLFILQIIFTYVLGSFAGVFGVIGYLIGLVGFVYWIIALVKAFSGNGQRFELPLVGGFIAPYAERLASSVS